MIKSFRILALLLVLCNFKAYSQSQSADMLEKVLGSVVTVAVYDTNPAKKTLGFRGNPTDIAYSKMLDLSNAQGSGSGFVIDRNGKKYIITNAHVVEQASDKNGSVYIYSITRKKYEAKIVGGDSFYDLAVLEFTQNPGSEITTVAFREPEIRVGEQVFAIGNPLGEYPYSVSEGIISAKNRVRNGLTGKFGFLQSTATVIWGNSGGPLVDNQGRVAGINSQIAFASMGGNSIWQPQINFALEANIATRLINEILENNGLVRRAFIGIQVTKSSVSLSPESPAYRRAAEAVAQEQHPIITGLIAGSPAAKALKGKIGYQIIAVNNNETRNAEEVLGEFEKVKPGDNVKLSIQQNNATQEITIKTVPLNNSRAIEMAQFLATNYGWTITENKNQVDITFKPSAGQNKTVERNSPLVNQNRERPGSSVSTDGQYNLVGIGIMEDNYENIWRVEQLGDVATAARLTALSGIIDLVLIRKGTDPNDAQNFIKKRITFSDSPSLIKPTLLY